MARTKYCYDGTDLIYEKDDDGAHREYYHGPDGLLSMYDSAGGGSRRYHFYDGMGSTSELTNESGTELGTYTYDAWGSQLSGPALTNPFRYIGKHGYYANAADGMPLLQQRYYRPGLGRFWTRDPIRGLSETNLYRYVKNRPTVQADPSGLYSLDLDTCGEWPKRRAIYEWTEEIYKRLKTPECAAAIRDAGCSSYIKPDLHDVSFKCTDNYLIVADTCGQEIRVNPNRAKAGDILHELVHACFNAKGRPYNPTHQYWKCPKCGLEYKLDPDLPPSLQPGWDKRWEWEAEKVRHACGWYL
jgi:RHS repeat-associated protein